MAKDWQRLFVTERALWKQAQLVLFGHALLEKLLQPRKNLVAHVYHLPIPLDVSLNLPLNPLSGQAVKADPNCNALNSWDALLAADLSSEKLATKPFAPLPVLGVPGWWPANEDPGFYDDARVFRR